MPWWWSCVVNIDTGWALSIEHCSLIDYRKQDPTLEIISTLEEGSSSRSLCKWYRRYDSLDLWIILARNVKINVRLQHFIRQSTLHMNFSSLVSFFLSPLLLLFLVMSRAVHEIERPRIEHGADHGIRALITSSTIKCETYKPVWKRRMNCRAKYYFVCGFIGKNKGLAQDGHLHQIVAREWIVFSQDDKKPQATAVQFLKNELCPLFPV